MGWRRKRTEGQPHLARKQGEDDKAQEEDGRLRRAGGVMEREEAGGRTRGAVEMPGDERQTPEATRRSTVTTLRRIYAL